MRILRITFVSLIAVGVCGGVYLGLTAGLAAYVRYRSGLVASVDAPPDAGPAAPSRSVEPPPVPVGVEDAASLMRRQWTGAKATLLTPTELKPLETRSRLLPAGGRTWLPVAQTRGAGSLVAAETAKQSTRFAILPKPASVMLASIEAPPADVLELVLTPANVTLPAGPAAKVESLDPDRIFLRTVGVIKNADRSTAQTEPTQRASERYLLIAPAPIRSSSAPFEKLSIPDPTPNQLGDVMTAVPDVDPPTAPPERPVKVQLPTK